MHIHSKELDLMLGDPKKAIRVMTIPLVISFLVIQLNSFADQAWCSSLGYNEMNAVSAMLPYYWIIAGLGAGIGVGATTAIARHLSKDEDEEANSLVAQSIFVSILISILMMVAVYATLDFAIYGMGVGEIHKECCDYLVPMIILTIPLVLNGVIPGIMRGEGAARKSMNLMLITVVLNIILDPIFIYTFNLGLSGAGWATGLSAFIGVIYGLWVYSNGSMHLSLKIKKFRVKKEQIYDVLIVGIPKTAESVIISAMSMFQRIFLVFAGGVLAVALYNVPWRYVSLCCVISMAIGAAMVPVCSAALAVNDIKKANDAFKYSFKRCMAIMLILAVVVFIFSEYLMIPFLTDDSTISHLDEFVKVLRLYALVIPIMGMIDIGSSMLQALRKAQISMIMAFLRNGIILLLFALTCNISLDALFISFVVAEFVGGPLMMVMAYWYFRDYRKKYQTSSFEMMGAQ